MEVLWEWGVSGAGRPRRGGAGACRRRGARAVAARVRAEGRRSEAGAVGDGTAELGEWVIALRWPVGEEFRRHGSRWWWHTGAERGGG